MQEVDLKATLEAYLAAFEQRDLAQCVDFFADDARVDFGMGVYRGKSAIEEWLKDRFNADVQVTSVDGIKMQGDTVIVDASVTSRAVRAWKFDSLAGRATFVFRQNKIVEAKYTLRTAIPVERW